MIKKKKYWPKYIDGDTIDAHSADNAVGTINSLPGKMHYLIPFHTYEMKESDYVMKLMSTYGTNELQADHPTKKFIKIQKKTVTTNFCHPEVMPNHL